MTTFTDSLRFLSTVLEEALRAGLFRKLLFERQITLCQLLLELGGAVEAVRYCAGHSGA